MVGLLLIVIVVVVAGIVAARVLGSRPAGGSATASAATPGAAADVVDARATAVTDRVRAWQQAGIIDAAQAERIVEFERAGAPTAVAAPAAAPHATRDLMQALFGVLGILLVGMGILATVITNWDSIGDPAKVAMLAAATLCAGVAGLVADRLGAPRWVGAVAYVVDMLCFVGGLFVIGTTYNVDLHAPFALLLSACAATGIALASQRMTIGWIGAGAWIGWATFEIIDSLEDLPEPELMITAVAAMIVAAAGVTALGWALTGLDERLLPIAIPLRTIGLGALLAVLVQASFAWNERDLVAHAVQRPEPWIAALAAVGAIALCSWRAPLEHRRLMAVAMAVVVGAALALTAWPHDVLITVAASVAVALGGIGLVLLGLVESRAELYGWGIAWLAVLVLTRYIDFMSSLDLGGPGFIGAGVLLLGVAWLVGRSRSVWREHEEALP